MSAPNTNAQGASAQSASLQTAGPQNAGLNPLAVELNEIITQQAPALMRMLSPLGKVLYYPKGILTQSAEAGQKAHRYNATIGEAREEQHSMGLPSITRQLCNLDPDQVLPYAPSAGRNDLRAAWLEEIKKKNPSLGDIPVSLPVVTSGITHGLSTVADMFLDEGDTLLVPDQVWGNYKLIFGIKRAARLVNYPLLRFGGRAGLEGGADLEDRAASEGAGPGGGFDLEGFGALVRQHAGAGKLAVLLNFPNNPTGYSITTAEAEAIRDLLIQAAAEQECDIIAICDDAYFGLFYDDEVLKESLFTLLAGAHPRILAIKLDGASKEDYAWGLRVAFITYGIAGGEGAYQALEKKTAGCIRGTISNSPNVSQALVLRAMNDPAYRKEKADKYAILAGRAAKARAILAQPKFDEVWTRYPFNSGYFLCVRLNHLHAEEYRVRLLNDYGIGVISTSDTDIRVAISCVDETDLDDLFDVMLTCALEMQAE